MKKKFIFSGLLATALFMGSNFIMSCGGGGSDNTLPVGSNTGSSGGSGGTGGTGGSGTAQTSTTYLSYVDISSGGKSLYFVDPYNPTQPVRITNLYGNTDYYTSSIVDNLDTTNFKYQNFHLHHLGYLNNGKIYLVSLRKGNTSPTVKQISNISDACYVNTSYTDSKTGKGYLIIATKGQDGQCGTFDDKKMFINTDMSSTSLPIDLTGKGIIAKIKGTDLLSISGFLVVIKGTNITLQKCDTNLANCNNLLTGILDGSNIGSKENSRNFYVCAKTNSTGINYHVFKFDGNSITDTNATCNINIWKNKKSTHIDSTGIYVIAGDGNLYKFDLKTYKTTQLYNGGDLIEIIDATASRIVALKKDAVTKIVLSKSNGSTVITTKGIFLRKAAQPNRLFFTDDTKGTPTNPTYSACYLDDNSTTPNCLNNYAWVGFSAARSGVYHIENNNLDIYKLIEIDMNTKTIYSVDPLNMSNKIQLGTLPPNYKPTFGHSLGVGKYILYMAHDISTNSLKDIFFVDVSSQNSLKQITNTPNKDEFVIR